MSRRVALILVTALCLGLVSCSHKYGLERQLQGPKLPSNAVVYVALPGPGSIGDRVYEQSGQQTGEAIVLSLAPFVARAELGSQIETADEARASATAADATHLVYPEIAHWEDRATEWTGKPDRIRILLHVYHVETGELLDAAEVSGTSRWGTFGGDHPEDLLDHAVGDYLSTLDSSRPGP